MNPKKPLDPLAAKIARSVIRLVTDYGKVREGWRDLGEQNRNRITRLAVRRVEKILATGKP